MRVSTERAKPLRDQASVHFGGGDATVDQWEIGAMHREHRSGDGACVRATWIKMPRDQVDRSIDFYRTDVLPSLEHLDGFCSASFMVNRATGRGVSSATFDSREAMSRNEENARELRNARTRELGAATVRTSWTSANSTFRSPICGCPRWRDRQRTSDRLTRAFIS